MWGLENISEAYILVAVGAILVAIGFYGLFTRRNIIKILISIEFLYNVAILELVVFFHYAYPEVMDALILALTLIAIAAVDVAFGIALAILMTKYYGAPDIDAAKKLADNLEEEVKENDG